ncbi:MAG: DUF1800 domain-containing protein [Planctomycetota bacterium]
MRATARLLPLALVALLLGTFAPVGAEDVTGDDAATSRARHLLRRATFGVRPGDVEAALDMGVEAWIDRQLDYATIPDPDVEKRLEAFESLALTGPEYWAMLQGGEMEGPAGPPKPGEDRIARAREQQARLNRLRNLARQEVPASVLVRAVYSNRQLFEVMRAFWRDHFNVDVDKDDVRYYVADWERDVLGKHVFGSFEDFLLATAKHPAMLFYLDNHVSQAPMARGDKVLRNREDPDRTGGLNENYARELMELHTVGCDRGYEQKDVIQLALVLTGWSIGSGDQRGTFVFRDAYHAKGPKKVMGKTVKDGEIEEGEAVLKYLAGHKNTAEFVVTKMAKYLVGDEPPAELVADVIKVWTKTKGDLKAVTKAILLHEAFSAPEQRMTKAKTPFEFVASALRVTGADIQNPQPLMARLADMAHPVYECEDPTGYSDAAIDWMDTGVLAVRWQFAYDLLHGRIGGLSLEASPLKEHVAQNPEIWEYLLVDSLLAGERPGSLTMAPFRRRIQTLRSTYRNLKPAQLEGELMRLATLVLGSPEFQRQ